MKKSNISPFFECSSSLFISNSDKKIIFLEETDMKFRQSKNKIFIK